MDIYLITPVIKQPVHQPLFTHSAHLFSHSAYLFTHSAHLFTHLAYLFTHLAHFFTHSAHLFPQDDEDDGLEGRRAGRGRAGHRGAHTATSADGMYHTIQCADRLA